MLPSGCLGWGGMVCVQILGYSCCVFFFLLLMGSLPLPSCCACFLTCYPPRRLLPSFFMVFLVSLGLKFGFHRDAEFYFILTDCHVLSILFSWVWLFLALFPVWCFFLEKLYLEWFNHEGRKMPVWKYCDLGFTCKIGGWNHYLLTLWEIYMIVLHSHKLSCSLTMHSWSGL